MRSALPSAEYGVSRVCSVECRVLALELPVHFALGWRRFTEIMAWQLSRRLRERFDELLARSPACTDRRFCDDARDAAASPPRNIAEGFGRHGRREFARYVTIARASLLETQTNLIIAKQRHYMSEAEFNTLWPLAEEAVATTTGLLKSLLTPREE